MNDYTLGAVEQRFAGIIWANAPLSSRRLVELAQQELGWKRSTTYTVLRRLSQRGLFANEGGEVRALICRDEFFALQSRQYVQQNFGGSLPQFLAAFAGRQKLSEAEIEALRRVIEREG